MVLISQTQGAPIYKAIKLCHVLSEQVFCEQGGDSEKINLALLAHHYFHEFKL